MIIHMARHTEKNIQLIKVKLGRERRGRVLEIMLARGFVEIPQDEWNRQHEAKRALLGWSVQS